MAKYRERERTGILARLLFWGIFAAVLFLWSYPPLIPLRALIVFIHEVFHGFAAILSGGSMVAIELGDNFTGRAFTEGGSQELILVSGYIGNILFGAILLVIAFLTRLDRLLSIALGAGMILISVFFISTPASMIFGIIIGVAFGLVGLILPTVVNEFMLKIIGMTSMLYPLIDVKEDLLFRAVPGSDAYIMGETFGIAPLFWIILWVVISVVSVYLIFRFIAFKRIPKGNNISIEN
jgi:hypothetical protein